MAEIKLDEARASQSRGVSFLKLLLTLSLALLASWDFYKEARHELGPHEVTASETEPSNPAAMHRLTFSGALEIFRRVDRSCWVTRLGGGQAMDLFGCDIDSWTDIQHDIEFESWLEDLKSHPLPPQEVSKRKIQYAIASYKLHYNAMTPPLCKSDLENACRSYRSDNILVQAFLIHLPAAVFTFHILWGEAWWWVIPWFFAFGFTYNEEKNKPRPLAWPFAMVAITIVVLLFGEAYFLMVRLIGLIATALVTLGGLIILGLTAYHAFESWEKVKHDLQTIHTLRRNPKR